MKRRDTPKSIERWQPPFNEEMKEAQPYNYAEMPDDVPSIEDWFKVRVWHDELNGLSLTN